MAKNYRPKLPWGYDPAVHDRLDPADAAHDIATNTVAAWDMGDDISLAEYIDDLTKRIVTRRAWRPTKLSEV